LAKKKTNSKNKAALASYFDKGTSKASSKGAEEARPPAKVRFTAHMPPDLIEEARDCVMHLAGPPEYLTLAGLAENALRREIDRLKRKHTGGEDFPPRPRELTRGRRPG